MLFLASKSMTKAIESLPPTLTPNVEILHNRRERLRGKGCGATIIRLVVGVVHAMPYCRHACVRLPSKHSRCPSQHRDSNHDAINRERCEATLADIAHEPSDRAVGDDE